ncbi:hypothetical protein Ahy_A09g044379 [Arachis hypogaea]|uniref:Uncharacterized protein n=1 Tax=Arachis hypogaea TaxID=3818 RepID=A0A445BJZ7_ARAHY|nr:hypothetical protein Ahy_A09g044379 [Arachis hypogaea]
MSAASSRIYYNFNFSSSRLPNSPVQWLCKPPHAPQACTNYVQNSEPNAEDLDPETDEVNLSVKEAMKPPNARKVVLRFNGELQPVGDEVVILNSILGLLGIDYTKFPICETYWRKVCTRDKVYNECVKEMFHFDEDSGRIIKRIILKMLGRAWKEIRNKLYHDCYTTGNYCGPLEMEKCKKNVKNRSKQLYTHTSGSKALQGSEKKR